MLVDDDEVDEGEDAGVDIEEGRGVVEVEEEYGAVVVEEEAGAQAVVVVPEEDQAGVLVVHSLYTGLELVIVAIVVVVVAGV